MRCPKCGTEVPSDALSCPKCNLLTPKGRTSRNLSLKKEAQHDQLGKAKRYLILGAVVIIVIGIASYAYLTLSLSSAIDPEAAVRSMNALRQMPSNKEGATVDDFMEQARKESEQAGRLVRYRGWFVQPINGTKSRILVVYSFEEQDGEQRAEWIADTSRNTFTPQTNLARGAFNK
jgi:hypothetical protein